MAAERPQTVHQLLTREIETLVDILEAIVGDGLDADERAGNLRPAHRVENAGSSAASIVIWV